MHLNPENHAIWKSGGENTVIPGESAVACCPAFLNNCTLWQNTSEKKKKSQPELAYIIYRLMHRANTVSNAWSITPLQPFSALQNMKLFSVEKAVMWHSGLIYRHWNDDMPISDAFWRRSDENAQPEWYNAYIFFNSLHKLRQHPAYLYASASKCSPVLRDNDHWCRFQSSVAMKLQKCSNEPTKPEAPVRTEQ